MDKCCGNCKLWDGGDCQWAIEFVRADGKLPAMFMSYIGDDMTGWMYAYEGTNCETWQKKEG